MEGKALHRSNYGVKTYTPEEIKNQWKEVVEVKLLNRLELSQRGPFIKLADLGDCSVFL